ncbi:phosphopantetheine-binding protein [Mycobacteroides abscessus]|uniref:phosphopantetheine-binding protein n=1 Tax=Mycobacteroides abscessus TaxID=36809 RepID=UPI00187831FC|nr:hypothetical protein [Mycobacteroides abscessus]MDM2082831.1 acyl carrier protein [Mycobacteroides abscessus]MDM2086005.1 acyl carrier protein [Mycobacteroides abscessus]
MEKGLVRSVVAQTLGIAVDDLHEVDGLSTRPGWDSLGHIKIIDELEKRFSRKLTAREVSSLTTLLDLENHFEHADT